MVWTFFAIAAGTTKVGYDAQIILRGTIFGLFL